MGDFSEAAAYEENSLEQERLGLGLIQRVNVKKGSKILDLGCGTGKITQVFSDLVGPEGKVVGIDPDTNRLKIAKEKHSAPNIEYLEADANHLPGGEYDLIFSNFVLHWIKNKEPVFQQAQKILKQGGLLASCSAIQNDGYFPPGEDTVSEEFRSDTMNNCFLVDVDEVNGYADQYGLKTEYFHKEVAKFDCRNIDGLIEFYMTHSPGKMSDISHFNVEKIKKYFGNNFVISIPLAIIIYRKA